MHRRRRTALLLSAAIVAAPLLTACGGDARPGAAAVVGDQRITVAQLENRVGEVRSAQRAAVSDDAQYAQVVAKSGTLSRDVLGNMVLDRVLRRAAQDAGVSVTRKEVQQMRGGLEKQVGGAEALRTAWLQQYGVPPQRLDENLRLQLEAQKLGTALGTDAGKPAFWDALAAASKKLDVRLNPRYGTWDMQKRGRADVRTPWVREVTAAARQPA
ncbi:lipoprotein [Streptomyces zinciresistens K42]|uniref:Lipoprotein n=1 Tax=Streptomyces zinciresistens K42 TaxID=700597 RepID=G2GAY5_9ACTN|nr:SurA N-terminal domain-containing protein [Streptomyces zinciresistens]EGX59376.1 lipoprotein [Streptomyces zinciresistens K42]